jgi:hypothetical protein
MSAQQAKTPVKTAVNEVEAAWRLFLANWIIIGAMGAVLGASLLAAGVSIEASGLITAIGCVGLYAGFAHSDGRSPMRRDPQVMFVLGGSAQIMLIMAIMAPLTNVATAMDFRMRDSSLLVIGPALDFDWTAYAAFVDAHPALASWLNCGYAMLRWPIFAVPMILAILAARQRYRRIEEFTFAFASALAATTILSAVVPAIGIYHQGGVDPAALKQATFPSFYAASAALYAWALWPLRRLRLFVIPVVGFILAATPANGRHAFVDLVAGTMAAIAAIVAAKAIGQLLVRRQAGCVASEAPVAAGRAAPMPAGALAE